MLFLSLSLGNVLNLQKVLQKADYSRIFKAESNTL